MRTRILSFIVISAGLLLVAPRLSGQRDIAVASLSVRQKVESLSLNAVRNVNAKKDAKARVKEVEKFLTEFKNLRAKSPRQVADDELYLDHLEGALRLVPLASFEKSKCSDYRSKVMSNYEPQSEKAQSAPIKRALEIIDSVCQ